MKAKYLSTLAALALAVTATVGLSACHDDYAEPPMEVPHATIDANISIYDLKTQFWQDDDNYIIEVPAREDGSHYVIKGRVISSDASGNIYKSLVIRDSWDNPDAPDAFKSALTLSIDYSNLYVEYRVGQEIVIDLTGMYIGKYSGLFQLGYPEFDDYDNTLSCSRMSYLFFKEHSQLNGLPEPDEAMPMLISYDQLSSSSTETLIKWQSQLVSFNDCSFEGAGELTFADYHENTNRTLVIGGANSIIVRSSGYANFWDKVLPEGTGSVSGILGYFGSSGWQLMLISYESCSGFEGMDEGKGSFDDPYTVHQVIGIENEGAFRTAWVKGYIVGAVAPGKDAVTSADDIEWTADASMPNTIVLGLTLDSKSLDEAIVVSLPQGTSIREYANLVAHPENYGREMWVRGSFNKVLDTYGVTTSGKSADFAIAGVEVPSDEVTDGDGSQASPYSASQALDMLKAGTAPTTNVYVKGIVVSIEEIDTGYGNATFNISNDGSASNTLKAYRCYALGNTKFTSSDQLKQGDEVVIYGKLSLYNSTAELAQGCYIYSQNGTTEGGGSSSDFPVTGNGDGSQANPYTASQALSMIIAGNIPSGKVYVTGKVVSITEVDTGTYGNATFYISDTGTTTGQLYVYQCFYLNGDKFTSADQIKVGDTVVVYGELTNYMGNSPQITKGGNLYSINGTTAGGGSDTPDVPEVNPGIDPAGAGTQASPYNVAKVLQLGATGEAAYVEGYIVGFVNGTVISKATFSAAGALASNLLIADSPDVNTATYCVPVNLKAGSAARTALNLADHPENLHKKLVVQASITTYFSVVGLKDITAYELK